MKNRIISVAGIAISILMALWESLEVLYNYGISGMAFYHSYYGTDQFQWARIESEDWVGFEFNQNKGLSWVKLDDRIIGYYFVSLQETCFVVRRCCKLISDHIITA